MPPPPLSSAVDVAPGRGRRPWRVRGALSLRAGALWTLSGSAVNAACQWLFLVLLVKLTRPEQVGHYALALALTAPAVMLLNLQLRSLLATETSDAFHFADYLGLRLLTALLGLVVGLAAAWLAGYRGAVFSLIAAVALGKALDAVSDVFYGGLQQHSRLDRVSVSIILRATLGLALGALVLRSGAGAAAAAATMTCATLGVLLAYDLPTTARVLAGGGPAAWRELRPRFRWAVLRRLALLALPLGVVMLLVSLIANVPRYFIEHLQGPAELGIYSAMAYGLTAGMLVVSAVAQAAAPRLARAFADARAAHFESLSRRLVLLSLALGAAGVLAALLVGPELLTLLYAPEYAQRQRAFVLVMAGAGIAYVAGSLGSIVTAARLLRAQVPMCLAVLATTALGCALWVPRHGVDGAALAVLAGFVVQLGGFALLYLRALRLLRARAQPPEG